jgi:hypothetical protein
MVFPDKMISVPKRLISVEMDEQAYYGGDHGRISACTVHSHQKVRRVYKREVDERKLVTNHIQQIIALAERNRNLRFVSHNSVTAIFFNVFF